ncbi:MAG: hypothetical protein DRG59_13810 [Deltaproteobacteria bacterium]|nr:MAG: hypothetical protein DRG59_13810 [Deltaproteobacteria bacterium]
MEIWQFMKKGQISSQIFVWMLVLVVVGLVAGIGYSGVKNLIEKQALASLVSFKRDAANAIYNTRDFGESRIWERRMPSGFNFVCFYDSDYSAAPGHPKYQSAFVEEYANSNNMFLIKSPQPISADMVEAFNVSKISLSAKYQCFNATGGTLRLRLSGEGRQGTQISVVQ